MSSNIQININDLGNPADVSPLSQSGVIMLSPTSHTHNYETQTRMQGLVITDEKGELVLTECESSHDFLIKPKVPYLLKFVVAPAVILMQLVVFIFMYSNLASTSCTNYASWNANVRYGIPVASVYVSAEITHQVLTATKMLLAAIFSRSPWPFFWSLVMAGQFIFEILVYSRVMAASPDLQNLIQNFVSLAVTNEADNKVGTMVGIEVGKILFMDKMVGEECCDLAGKRVPGSPARFTKKHYDDDRPMSPLQKKLKLIRETARFGPNNLNWLLYSNATWSLRVTMFCIILSAMLSYIFILLTITCPVSVTSFKAPYSGNVGPMIPGSTLKELLATQRKKYSDLYRYYQKNSANITDYSFEEVHLADDAQIDLDFATYDFRFPFFSSPTNEYTYCGAALTSNGLISLNQGVGKTSTAFPTITNSFNAAIAPFFADMDAVNWAARNGTSHIYKFGSKDLFIVVFEEVPLSSPCVLYQLGDGNCDDGNNIKECNWDNGDCCKETCKPKTRRTTYSYGPDYVFGSEDPDEDKYNYEHMDYTKDGFVGKRARGLSSTTPTSLANTANTATSAAGPSSPASTSNTASSHSSSNPGSPSYSTSWSGSSWSPSSWSSSSWWSSWSSWSNSHPSYYSSWYSYSYYPWWYSSSGGSSWLNHYYQSGFSAFTSSSSSGIPAGTPAVTSCTVFNCKDPDTSENTFVPFKGTVSFEVMMTSCGLLQISYTGNFTAPPLDAYTIGFQWEALADQPTDSSCRGNECLMYYNISEGYQLTLNSTSPTAKGCGTAQYMLMPNMWLNDTYVKAFKTSPALLGLNRTGIICRVADYARLGDGRCDDERAAGNYNSAACGFDKGDCCPKTCVSKIYYCGNTKSWDSCVDPCQTTPGDLCATSI